MRAEKEDPGRRYDDFWDWLRADWHPIWILGIIFGYVYYLMTTEEV